SWPIAPPTSWPATVSAPCSPVDSRAGAARGDRGARRRFSVLMQPESFWQEHPDQALVEDANFALPPSFLLRRFLSPSLSSIVAAGGQGDADGSSGKIQEG